MEKPLIDRIYHPYWLWEETAHNMWGSVRDREEYLQRAIEFTGDHSQYGAAMLEVVRNWKYSCEHNLSNATQNRKAWIGHAACAFRFRCPEDIVRQAWGHLSDEQQRLANKEAEKAIAFWEMNNGKGGVGNGRTSSSPGPAQLGLW
jgi:hypothetical protein